MTNVTGTEVDRLRARVAQIRGELSRATQNYRQAAARRNSQDSIELLRLRSRLMRQLLEAQCQLLLSFRSAAAGEANDGGAEPTPALPQTAVT